MLALALIQPANKAPGPAVIPEQTRTGVDRGPGQHGSRPVSLSRPAEALPVGHLVEVMQLLSINGQLCLHHLRYRTRLKLKSDALAAIGKQNVRQLAQLVNGPQEGRVKTQPLAVDLIRHPLAALFVQHTAEFRRQEALNAPAVLTHKFSQHRQRGIAFTLSKRETPVKGGAPVRHHGAAPFVIQAGR